MPTMQTQGKGRDMEIQADQPGSTRIHAAVSMTLPAVPCPLCGSLLSSRSFRPNSRGGAAAATDFGSCLRRCEPCGVGLSNAASTDVDQLQKIDRELLRGVPEWLR